MSCMCCAIILSAHNLPGSAVKKTTMEMRSTQLQLPGNKCDTGDSVAALPPLRSCHTSPSLLGPMDSAHTINRLQRLLKSIIDTSQDPQPQPSRLRLISIIELSSFVRGLWISLGSRDAMREMQTIKMRTRRKSYGDKKKGL